VINPYADPVHVMPMDDWIEHKCDPACECNPREDIPGCYVHNSLKGLEIMERVDQLGGMSLS